MAYITDIQTRTVSFPRKEIFRISTGTSKKIENVIIRIKTDEIEGTGVAVPNSVTGDTKKFIITTLKKLQKQIKGQSETIMKSIYFNLYEESRACACAFDESMLDIYSKRSGVPLYKYLNPAAKKKRIETDITIGVCSTEETVKRAERYFRKGIKILKIKLEGDIKKDIERIRILSENISSKIVLRIDANQAYSREKAIKLVRKCEKYNIELFEQPVKMNDYKGLTKVAKSSSIPIFADESVKSVEDIYRILEHGKIHGINIKLTKVGGITPALNMLSVGKEHGFEFMVGCYGETSASIYYGLQFALAFSALVKYVDLDSHFFIDEKNSFEKRFEVKGAHLVV